MMDRKQVEREFHDRLRTIGDDPHVSDTRWSPKMEKTVRANPLWANMKYYAIERRSRDTVLSWYDSNVDGRSVLDYCCGNGEDGVLIAQKGAKEVVGIDLSGVSVENAHRLAVREGVADKVTHQVADAEATGFSDNRFDIITEYGSLHHVDLHLAFAEMARVLKPDGKAICQEALAHNLLIHAYRRLTPKLRTPWEVDHILRRSSFKVAESYFGRIEMKFFHLFSLFAVPFRNTPLFVPLLAVLELLDDVMLRVPGLKWQAWQTVFVLSEPRKNATGATPGEPLAEGQE
jgi:ubiquinone/menaquinone biosynthesis C-methylase UbiE